MEHFYYNVSHIDRSESSDQGDDVDNDVILPRLISHFEDNYDTNSNDPATIFFCEDDDDPNVVVLSIMLTIFPLPFCSRYFGTDLHW